MTKLTAHRCDLCQALLYEQEETIYKLQADFIDSIAETRSQNEELEWELCQKCYDKFLDWIQKRCKDGD